MTITCTGSAIQNSATHVGTGKIKASGYASGIQTIGGSGAGLFHNLEFASTPPQSIAFSTNQRVSKLVTLTSGVVNLAQNNLWLSDSAPFRMAHQSTTKTLTTNGQPTDGGVTKVFKSTTGIFKVPFAYGGLLRPVQESVTAATYGSITVVPVDGRHPTLTLPPGTINDALKCYWHVSSTGFTGITDVLLNFKYDTLDCPAAGRSADDSNYVVGRYNSAINYWTTENLHHAGQ